LKTAFVKFHCSRLRMGFRIQQEFLCEYPEDRRRTGCLLRPWIAWMNLTKPQCAPVLILSVPGIVPVLSPSRFHYAEALFGSVRVFYCPSEVVPVGFASFVDHRCASLGFGFGFGFSLFFLALGRPPSLPFSRDACFFASLVMLPRHAGQ